MNDRAWLLEGLPRRNRLYARLYKPLPSRFSSFRGRWQSRWNRWLLRVFRNLPGPAAMVRIVDDVVMPTRDAIQMLPVEQVSSPFKSGYGSRPSLSMHDVLLPYVRKGRSPYPLRQDDLSRHTYMWNLTPYHPVIGPDGGPQRSPLWDEPQALPDL